LLVAFLAAVMVTGGGGVSAPWLPKPGGDPSGTATANAAPIVMGGSWARLRME